MKTNLVDHLNFGNVKLGLGYSSGNGTAEGMFSTFMLVTLQGGLLSVELCYRYRYKNNTTIGYSSSILDTKIDDAIANRYYNTKWAGGPDMYE